MFLSNKVYVLFCSDEGQYTSNNTVPPSLSPYLPLSLALALSLALSRSISPYLSLFCLSLAPPLSPSLPPFLPLPPLSPSLPGKPWPMYGRRHLNVLPSVHYPLFVHTVLNLPGIRVPYIDTSVTDISSNLILLFRCPCLTNFRFSITQCSRLFAAPRLTSVDIILCLRSRLFEARIATTITRIPFYVSLRISLEPN